MYTNERYEAGHDHALLKLRKEFEKHRAAENNPHNLNLEAMDYRNYTRDALDLPISNDAADAFAGTVASIKARIIDPYDGNVEISFFNADGEQLGKTEFSMDSEKAISSVELDAAHRRLVFNRFALAPLYCSLEDLYSLLDGYKEQIDLNTANIAINAENIATNAEKIAENAEAIAANTERIAEEEIRAAGAEKRIEDGLADEIRRATIAEAVLRTAVADEAQARETADDELASDIEAEANARNSADSLLQTAIREETESRLLADAAEVTARADADADLLTKIEKEISDRESADALKQDKLTAGDHITIDEANRISAVYDLVSANEPGLMPSDLFTEVNNGLEKLSGIEEGANKNVQADWNEESISSDAYIKNKPEVVSAFINDAHYQTDIEVAASIASYHDDTKADDADLATVAKSGSYNDLIDKPEIPVIPTDISAFNNDVGYLTEHQSLADYAKKSDLEDFVKSDDLADVAFSGSYNDLIDKPDIYTKPESGIPATDLAQDVQDDLSGISEHISDTDIHVTINDKANWNGKSVVEGTEDGTNWTSLKIDGVRRGIPSGGSSGGSLVVQFSKDTEGNWQCDKTFTEIKQALPNVIGVEKTHNGPYTSTKIYYPCINNDNSQDSGVSIDEIDFICRQSYYEDYKGYYDPEFDSDMGIRCDNYHFLLINQPDRFEIKQLVLNSYEFDGYGLGYLLEGDGPVTVDAVDRLTAKVGLDTNKLGQLFEGEDPISVQTEGGKVKVKLDSEYVKGTPDDDGNWKTITINGVTRGFPTSEEPVKPIKDLGGWNCGNGIPKELSLPYTASKGDFFHLVNILDNTHNVRPIGNPIDYGDTELDTRDLLTTDLYVFDGEDWILYREQPAPSTSYNDLDDKPSINDVPLVGNKTSEDLGIVDKSDFDSHVEEFDALADTVNNHIGNSTHITATERNLWNGKSTVTGEYDDAGVWSTITIDGIEKKVNTGDVRILNNVLVHWPLDDSTVSGRSTTDASICKAIGDNWEAMSTRGYIFERTLTKPKLPVITLTNVSELADLLIKDRHTVYIIGQPADSTVTTQFTWEVKLLGYNMRDAETIGNIRFALVYGPITMYYFVNGTIIYSSIDIKQPVLGGSFSQRIG